jgi:hypothetical protein
MKRKTNRMEKEDVENYLKQLEGFEKTIGSDDDEIDLNFVTELNDLLNKLQEDLGTPPVTEQNIVNTQPIINTQPTMTGGGVLVKVKKLDSNAVIPSYSKVGDAGMDLTITKEIENTSFSVSYGFGLSMEIPKGFVGLIFPRSSVRNYELSLTNCVGVIDSTHIMGRRVEQEREQLRVA